MESAAKAKTLGKFLGKNYRIKASVGHVKDLPKSKLGIDVEGSFEPQYITIRGKGSILKEIREESAKASRVLLATDPDREGEAIAWHLQNAIKIPAGSNCRIEFNEITKDAVLKAIKKSRPVDMDRVNAQQARRVVDRLVGYNLSPLLWSKVRKGLSAGRVQSVVVRLICEREEEIEQFVSEEYWTIEAELADDKKGNLTAKLHSFKGDKIQIGNEESKQQIVDDLEKATFLVSKVEKREQVRRPLAPFTTSTMQQEANRKLSFYSKRTMKVAQELYEGLPVNKEGTVGLITYLRTDSTRIASVAQVEAQQFISEKFGPEYAPAKPNEYKGKKGAQDAHEAIRPTLVSRTPESIKDSLSRDQFRLYKLIWERFVASQMTAAVYDRVSVDIKADEYGLKVSSSKLKFPGYRKVYKDGDEEKAGQSLPELKKGQVLKLVKIAAEQHFTQPPPRFNEATLVKFLEENNIGRPSTYAPIIDTILKRHYVERQSRQFAPTELGTIVVGLLKNNFPQIMDVEFTARMEEELDLIEDGKLDWRQVVTGFYGPFAADLEKAKDLIDKVEIKDEDAGKPCPKCGSPLFIKYGRFGKFLACSAFPECRHTESINEETGVDCPLCGGKVLALKSKKGRRFYGCSNYPECKLLSWQPPTGESCPNCGHFLVQKTSAKKPPQILCPNSECKYVKSEEN